jgi:hypothetical protein
MEFQAYISKIHSNNAVISKLFEPRHTSQVLLIFFAPNLVFLIMDEVNLRLNLSQNFNINIFESLRHFSRHSKFFWRHTQFADHCNNGMLKWNLRMEFKK